jgi:dihydroflavonol-4-reductase
VVKRLLARGHTVHGTVGDPHNAAKVDPRLALDGSSDRLTLFTADLLDSKSFDAAVNGCDVVMHVASPYVVDVEDAQRDLVDPALNGTNSALAAANASDVKRVVLTSSAAAITDEPEDRIYTEADWNERSTLQRNPYCYSKTVAERAAWRFVEENDPTFDLVVINPTGVIGPSIGSGLSTTSRIIADLLKGSVYPAIIDVTLAYVDVRDVAEAHVRAADNRDAAGRYICSKELVSLEHTIDVLRNNGFDN